MAAVSKISNNFIRTRSSRHVDIAEDGAFLCDEFIVKELEEDYRDRNRCHYAFHLHVVLF